METSALVHWRVLVLPGDLHGHLLEPSVCLHSPILDVQGTQDPAWCVGGPGAVLSRPGCEADPTLPPAGPDSYSVWGAAVLADEAHDVTNHARISFHAASRMPA